MLLIYFKYFIFINLVNYKRENIISTFEEILKKLETNFIGGEVNLENTSSKHIGHNSSGMHLKATIKYDGFKGKTTLDCHRMVHNILKDEIGKEIHAITIHTTYNE